MKNKNFVISLIIFCILVLASVFFVENDNFEEIDQEKTFYKVTRVIDGDTLEVDNEQKVRMIGIDTPETVHPSKPVEYFGKEASDKLKEMIEGKEVELVPDPTQDDVDRYGRWLRYVYLNGVDINLEMIKQGYAFEYTYRIPYEKQNEYKKAQEFAKENELGLWNN